MYALILLCCLLSAGSTDQPINNNLPTKIETHQAPDNGKSNPASSIASNAPPDEPQDQSHSKEDESTLSGTAQRIEILPQSDWWFKWYVIATLIIAALNFGMLIAIRHQRNAMREQLKVMQEDSKQNQQLIRLEHRAWIKFSKVDFTIEPQKILNLNVSFVNIGRTPARDFCAWIFIETLGNSAEPALSYEKDRNVPARPVVPPNSPLVFPLAFELLTQHMYANVMSGKLRVMFHGKISYKDIFEGKHWMTFCQEFDPDVGQFMIYKKHNDEDY